jgi:thiamine-phosphate pyrophosphorylase
MNDPFPWRVADANLNRLREGLRVVEDLLRYQWNSPLAKEFKKLRHQTILPSDFTLQLLQNRNVEGDIFRKEEEKEVREGVLAVVVANFKRAEESARVLEEIFKLLDFKFSRKFKEIRYTLYRLEREVIFQLNEKVTLFQREKNGK